MYTHTTRTCMLLMSHLFGQLKFVSKSIWFCDFSVFFYFFFFFFCFWLICWFYVFNVRSLFLSISAYLFLSTSVLWFFWSFKAKFSVSSSLSALFFLSLSLSIAIETFETVRCMIEPCRWFPTKKQISFIHICIWIVCMVPKWSKFKEKKTPKHAFANSKSPNLMQWQPKSYWYG